MPSNDSNGSRQVKVYGQKKRKSILPKVLAIAVCGIGSVVAIRTFALVPSPAQPEPSSLVQELPTPAPQPAPEPVAAAPSAPDHYSLAQDRTAAAEALANLAMSPDDWTLVASRWGQVLELLQAVPEGHDDYQSAQAQLKQAEGALAQAQAQAQNQTRAANPAPTSPQSASPPAQVSQAATAEPKAETWQVLRVADGDTITVTRNGQQERVRSACIDAPEGDQPLGPESSARLQQMINQANGQVELIITDRDRYGRMIAEIYAGGQLTQAVLVREGLAWSYRQFHYNCPSADLINQIEAQARQQRVGVFSEGHIEPWEWRRGAR